MSKSKEQYTPDNWDLQFMNPERKVEGLTKSEAYAIAWHIDMTLMQEIRENHDIDSMQWLCNIIHGYEKLCAASGFVGLTEGSNE